MEAIPVHGAEAGQVDGLKKKKKKNSEWLQWQLQYIIKCHKMLK